MGAIKEAVRGLFSNFRSVALIAAVVPLFIAVAGAVPTPWAAEDFREIEPISRLLWVALGLAIVGIAIALDHWIHEFDSPKAPKNPEYAQRLQAQERIIASAVPQEKKILECEIAETRVQVISGDITEASADVLVSSDDNLLAAEGGVAKAILERGGEEVRAQLRKPRREHVPFGHIAVTRAGGLDARYVFHPAVVDRTDDRWPDEGVVRRASRHALACARALGLERIAFPLLGSGTGGLDEHASLAAVASEVAADLRRGGDHRFKRIDIYVYATGQFKGDPREVAMHALGVPN